MMATRRKHIGMRALIDGTNGDMVAVHRETYRPVSLDVWAWSQVCPHSYQLRLG